MEQIWGYVERITFHNAENGFTVAKIKEPRKTELTTVVGTLHQIQPGETIRCFGSWKCNPSHGMQFEVHDYKREAPADLLGIQKYLESGLIKGIGHAYAKRIVERFGLDTLKVIDEDPSLLAEVEGLGPKRIEKIRTCWSNQKSIREVMLFLQQFGVTPSFAQKIFKCYGNESIEKIRSDPFCLAREIRGVGFKTADQLASKMGLAKDAPERIEAGIEFVLSELSSDGHICYPEHELIAAAHKMLDLPIELIEERLASLQSQQRVMADQLTINEAAQTFIWLKLFYLCEKGIAREIGRLKKSISPLRQIDTLKAIIWVQEQLQLSLADNQKQAVIQALQDKFQIITGGPGTGKSTIIKAILAISSKLTRKILLAAPTGRAAKRMSEITGYEAKTIHSLLEWSFSQNGFKRNRDTPLECDLIIIDEASMIDTMLMYHLLKAIPSTARVIFVGDINQLPSVGPGNVLQDLIQSRRLPVTELKEIYRQAKGSKIITNAHLINQGIFPDLRAGPRNDFFFIKEKETEKILEIILELVQTRLPRSYRFEAINEIQVLTPMKKGPIGTERLNLALQEKLNPNNNPLIYGGKRFHKGDKVMQIRNNYQKEVYNGDIGRITTIDWEAQELTVCFDQLIVVYEFHELDELVLAYAVSVHKYQGSQCKCIIMPIHSCHYILLHRNLLYTGVTRAEKLMVLVGTSQAMHMAIHNDEVKQRYTGLLQAIQAHIS